MDFILATENIPFSVALAVMLSIAALEGVGALMGLGLSTLLESLSPDVDLNVDGPDIHSTTTFSHFMSWLRVGKVPLLILLVIFLTAFGLIGIILQKISLGMSGSLLPTWLAVVPAFLGALPCLRIFGNIAAKLIPQDETEAVSEGSFIGRIAIITLGTATTSSPAEARLKDEHQQSHYIMVKPDNEHEKFESGSLVLIVSKSGPVYHAITNPNKSLA